MNAPRPHADSSLPQEHLGERRLPSPSWLALHGKFPEGPFFDPPCFQALARLGIERIEWLARELIVSTPGTLGHEGSWRLRNHRIGAQQIFGMAFNRAALQSSDADLSATLGAPPWALVAFDGSDGAHLRHVVLACSQMLGLKIADQLPSTDDSVTLQIMAGFCFVLAHPDLACAQAFERGSPSLGYMLRESLARAEAAQISQSLAPTALPLHAPRL